jgi:hypothetical protein
VTGSLVAQFVSAFIVYITDRFQSNANASTTTTPAMNGFDSADPDDSTATSPTSTAFDPQEPHLG